MNGSSALIQYKKRINKLLKITDKCDIMSELDKMFNPDSYDGHVYECDGDCDNCDPHNCIEKLYN